MLNHGIKRELFVAPLAINARSFLRGQVRTPRYFNLSFDKAALFWRERWLLPRAERDLSYRDFDREQWRLWKEASNARR
jgi:hypothetical protein